MADRPARVAAAKTTLDVRGYGMASVRVLRGTRALRRQRKAEVAACFDSDGAPFEPPRGSEGAVVSDALDHAPAK